MWRILVVALVLCGVARADDDDNAQKRSELIAEIKQLVTDIPGKIPGDLDGAIDNASGVKSKLSELDGVKGDDSTAEDMIDHWGDFADNFIDATNQLKQLVLWQEWFKGVFVGTVRRVRRLDGDDLGLRHQAVEGAVLPEGVAAPRPEGLGSSTPALGTCGDRRARARGAGHRRRRIAAAAGGSVAARAVGWAHLFRGQRCGQHRGLVRQSRPAELAGAGAPAPGERSGL
ncbi:MAG: hypothetical protein ABI467_17725 [Kofleriaceae bacterium]